MTTYDLSPLFRSTVGFDRLAKLMDNAMRVNGAAEGFPPYNIAALGEDRYRISIAVAGFTRDELNIEVESQTMTVTGTRSDEDDSVSYLHKGIAGRNFVRKFQLADYVEVVDAQLVNGLLTIDLKRDVPAEMKPRTIEIETSKPKRLADKAKKLLTGEGKAKAA